MNQIKNIHPTTKVDPTAIIDNGAKIGANCKIWQWVHVSKGAKIGENCSFGQNVYIANRVFIGNNVKVQNNVSIYDNVTLENNVFCGPSVVFTNVINPRSKINRKDEYKDTLVKEGATLGANCTIICGITIGESAFIGAGAVITKNVKDFALVTGVPGNQVGWMSSFGERIPLPLEGKGRWICKKSKKEYYLCNSILKSSDL
tara:strand:+ start:9964 stop:10569 length:606 start_codon:yes stop_codon:yes gene_type:complete